MKETRNVMKLACVIDSWWESCVHEGFYLFFVTDRVLKSVWFQRLLNYFHAILTFADGTLDKLAQLAHKLVNTVPTGNQINFFKSNSSTTSDSPATLSQCIDKFTKIIKALNRPNISQLSYRSHSRSRYHKRPLSRSKSWDRSDICSYHRRFGDETRKCAPSLAV